MSSSSICSSARFGTTLGRTARPIWRLSLDASGGTLLGLNYSLSLPVTAGTGNGLPQTYSINGTAAANQVGTCATATCSATALRTLTITY